MILGIDEVGRGPWAGPLVVGAVVLPADVKELVGLTDSKKLSAKRRQELDAIIREKALAWGLGWVHAEELDEVGLSAALRLATIRAVEGVKTPYHEIIIDGTINFLKETPKGKYVTTLPKADFLIPAVSAASIIAKVARDTFMEEQDVIHPGYGFGAHVGYGTARHTEALKTLGVTELHRKSFAPIAKLISGQELSRKNQTSLKPSAVTPGVVTAKSIGNAAEDMAATWLEARGYLVLERNWKTKHCEIDIIASHNSIIYFVEVKYRSSSKQGGGIAAVTPKKLKQMQFAAELYGAREKLKDNLQLAVIVVDSSNAIELVQIDESLANFRSVGL